MEFSIMNSIYNRNTINKYHCVLEIHRILEYTVTKSALLQQSIAPHGDETKSYNTARQSSAIWIMELNHRVRGRERPREVERDREVGKQKIDDRLDSYSLPRFRSTAMLNISILHNRWVTYGFEKSLVIIEWLHTFARTSVANVIDLIRVPEALITSIRCVWEKETVYSNTSDESLNKIKYSRSKQRQEKLVKLNQCNNDEQLLTVVRRVNTWL